MSQTHFTVAMWCLFFSALLPFVAAIIAKYPGFGRRRSEGGFDNRNPREWLARQSGYQARANAAQQNTFEALPFFFAAVLLAHYLQAPQGVLDILCITWLLLRSVYLMAYVADQHVLRSAIWFAALAINVVILFLGYR